MKTEKISLSVVYYFADEKKLELSADRLLYKTVIGQNLADCWQKFETYCVDRTQVDSAIYWNLVRVKRVHIQPIRGAK
jgi:hypothetical protein